MSSPYRCIVCAGPLASNQEKMQSVCRSCFAKGMDVAGPPVSEVPKRVAPSAETRETREWLASNYHQMVVPGCGSMTNIGRWTHTGELVDVLDAHYAHRTSLPPAATSCCTATEVEAARNPNNEPACDHHNMYRVDPGSDEKLCPDCRHRTAGLAEISVPNPERTLEERAQEAAEEIDAQYEFYISFIDDPRDKVIAKVKAIILSRIGGAE